MINAFKKPIKLFTYSIIILFSMSVKAQVSILQNTIDKLESYQNFSYQSISRVKEIFVNDTVTEQHHATFEKAPHDKNFGYLIQVETINNTVKCTDLYNGQNLIHANAQDSTYSTQDIHQFGFQKTLPGSLRWIQSRLQIKSSKIVKAKDTTVNAIKSYHLIATVYDTLINKERNYTIADLYISKISGMPGYLIIKSRNSTYGNGISNYYSASSYSDYKFNQDNINIATMPIPQGYHLPKKPPILPKEQSHLLSVGNIAPDWTLYDANGNKTSFSKMRGRVVILDFFFIGCFGCMESLKPLNNIDRKYKDRNVAVISLNAIDSKSSIQKFEKNYHIQYPAYLNAANEVKLYHVQAFPTFYFIDKDGKIANVITGYSDDFEMKAISIIDDLLKK